MLTLPSFLNESTPFSLNEYDGEWKDPLYVPWGINQYPDFDVCFKSLSMQS